MNQIQFKWVWALLVVTAGILVFSGCLTSQPKPGQVFSCVKDSDVTKVIAKEASLEEFSCVVKRWDGADTLHFNVAVKNISSRDQRFKVNIFLENGKAVGGLIPRKTKKGLIKPGQVARFTYPVKGVSGSPGKIDLFIKTMGQ